MKSLLFLIILTVGLPSKIKSQTQSENTTKIALLGTFHFAGSSGDAMALKVEDILGEKRQKEIEDLVDKLAEFNPTKLILEYPYGDTALDSVYQLYKKGEKKLAINERQQIGFRLAKKLDHDHIYVADHKMDLPFNDLQEYLSRTGQMHIMEEFMGYIKVNAIDVMQEAYDKMNMIDFLRFINQEEFDAENKNLYLEFLTPIGFEDGNIGLKLTATWWERNLKIMQNIDQITEEGDRVLVIFGQGHTAILKDLYHNRSNAEYVEIKNFLK